MHKEGDKKPVCFVMILLLLLQNKSINTQATSSNTSHECRSQYNKYAFSYESHSRSSYLNELFESIDNESSIFDNNFSI